MKKDILIYFISFYSCVYFNKVGPDISEVCPNLNSGSRIELKKINKTHDTKSYLGIHKNFIDYKGNNSYIKIDPGLGEILYNGKKFKKKHEDYSKKIYEFIKQLDYFRDSRWINFRIEDVIECIENSK